MLFVSNAFAQATNAGEPNPMITILMFAGLFGFMYFLIIRPQRKRQKEHNELVGALGKGDEVVTTSGMLGKITKLEGDYVVLEVSNNLELKFQKVAVHAVLPQRHYQGYLRLSVSLDRFLCALQRSLPDSYLVMFEGTDRLSISQRPICAH